MIVPQQIVGVDAVAENCKFKGLVLRRFIDCYLPRTLIKTTVGITESTVADGEHQRRVVNVNVESLRLNWGNQQPP
jgi:hypothetical protein